jgi:hypothetical protein
MEACAEASKVALVGFRGGEHHLRDQAGDEGAEQRLSAAPGIVDGLKEAEIGRQLLLRDAAMGSEPGAQQGPEAFQGVDVHSQNPSPSSSRAYSPWAWQTVLYR